jgi:hypothetical protein
MVPAAPCGIRNLEAIGAAVAVTMPPWPGPDEAYEVTGPWPADPA